MAPSPRARSPLEQFGHRGRNGRRGQTSTEEHRGQHGQGRLRRLEGQQERDDGHRRRGPEEDRPIRHHGGVRQSQEATRRRHGHEQDVEHSDSSAGQPVLLSLITDGRRNDPSGPSVIVRTLGPVDTPPAGLRFAYRFFGWRIEEPYRQWLLADLADPTWLRRYRLRHLAFVTVAAALILGSFQWRYDRFPWAGVGGSSAARSVPSSVRRDFARRSLVASCFPARRRRGGTGSRT